MEDRLAQRAKITPLLLQLDGLLTPGAPGVAPEGLESTGNAAMQRPWSTMGIPTIALPTGLNQDGLPLGQLVGAPSLNKPCRGLVV
jgi:Asp-tRNA(Asn)/Glu-tRNA(Gln) amidotransferase A subunit family amidase